MGRIKANDGQELIYGDVNKIATLLERELYDRILCELLQKTYNGFFSTGFQVSFVNATSVQIAAGLGIQHDASQISPEPTKRMLWLPAAVNKTIAVADPANPRVDIVCVKHGRASTLNENRRYKATLSEAPVMQAFDVETDWLADTLVVTGTPGAVPAVPATPTGYIKIAEVAVDAASGVAGAGSITDRRVILGYGENIRIDSSAFTGVATKAAGTKLKQVLADLDAVATRNAVGMFDAIVGTAAGCTHSTLSAAVAAVSAGARILIAENLTLNAPVTLSKANLCVEAKPGVTLSNGSAGTGLVIGASGCRIRGVRFAGFATAISILDTFNYNFVTECRFGSSVVDDVVDSNAAPNNVIANNINE